MKVACMAAVVGLTAHAETLYDFELTESGGNKTPADPARPAAIERPTQPLRDTGVPPLSSDDRSSKWDDWLRQGETAEDNGDYETAEKFLSQACGLLETRLPIPADRARACIRLAKFHAVQGEFNKAGKVLRQLLKTLRSPTSSQPFNIVEALLVLAEVYAAQSRPDSTAETLHEVMPLLNELTQPQRSRALARISGFFLAVTNRIEPNNSNRMELNNRNRTARELGIRLLKQAQAGLKAQHDFDPAEYVTAATEVAGVLRWSGREKAANKLNQEIKKWRQQISRRSGDRPSSVKKVGGTFWRQDSCRVRSRPIRLERRALVWKAQSFSPSKSGQMVGRTISGSSGTYPLVCRGRRYKRCEHGAFSLAASWASRSRLRRSLK